MIVPFSPKIPLESHKGDDFYFPFKQFVIEINENILKKKFSENKKAIVKELPPFCMVCDMHFTSFSIINSGDKNEKSWVCALCDKINPFDPAIKTPKGKNKYFIEYEEENEYLNNSLIDFSNVEFLTIFVIDYSSLMKGEKITYNKEELPYTTGLANFLSDYAKNIKESHTKMCVILCNTKINIFGNSTQELDNVLTFPKIEKLSQCFGYGESIAHTLFTVSGSYKPLIKFLEKNEPRSLSTIGSGFAVALGILEEIKPIGNKIVIIGGGDCSCGPFQTIRINSSKKTLENVKDDDEFLKKDYSKLNKYTKQSPLVNLLIYDVNKSKPNFFENLKSNLKKSKKFEINEMGHLSTTKTMSIESKDFNILSIFSTQNVVLAPFESTDQNYGNFVQKDPIWVNKNFNPKTKLFPIGFEFSTIRSNRNNIILQCEYKKRVNDKINLFIHAKSIEITKFDKIDRSLFNFTVSNFCYYLNDYFKKSAVEKRRRYCDLINYYLEKDKTQAELLILLRNYIINEKKLSFEIRLPIENDLKKFVPLKKGDLIGNKLDFYNINRIVKNKY